MDTGLHSLKLLSEKVVRKAGKFVGNRIADGVTMTKL